MIPTLGSEGALSRVLEGYAAQPELGTGELEVIVVLDAAAGQPEAGATERLLAARLPGARLVRAKRPGASANRNAGAATARAPVVLFTDDDTIPATGLVREHLAWHANHPGPEVGVLGLVRWAPELEPTTFMRWLDRGIQFDYPFIAGIEAGWGRFFSANVSVKRAFMLDTVGGFDEVNFPYGYEDLDFGLRAEGAGMRLLYNRAAIVDHLREMTPEFWLKRIRRIAAAEHRFTRMHPEIEPWFRRIFEHVDSLPAASGRGRHVARWVPPGTPWLGPRVWNSTDLYFKQLLAPAFLEAWAEAEHAEQMPRGPDLSERG